MEDTIVSISTPVGNGAISIIRLSGKEAISITQKIYKGKDLASVPTNTINYGYIVDNNKKIDEVLVSIMRSPHTYTTEDVVEINTHGGIASTNKVLELCISHGARIAQPGEFTKRAFLNGRLDLTEAEAVEDIITSTTDKSLALSMNQLTGSLKNLIIELRKTIMSLIANIEVNIDYPEYEDAENITIESLNNKIPVIKEQLDMLLKESENAKIIKDGINVAIIGRPNVGKSSLLNCLLEENKAIVTNVAGTTRDIVEGSIILKDIKLNFIDTAGIRATNDIVEKIGVEKSKEMINKADLVILLLNNNEELNKEDDSLLTLISSKTNIVFINKNDLESKLDIKKLSHKNIIIGNTQSSDGIKKLKDKIIEMFNLEKLNNKDATYLTNSRQKGLIKKAIASLDSAKDGVDNSSPVDLIEIDLRECWDTLGEIIGSTYKDELLDELFSNFCLGK